MRESSTKANLRNVHIWVGKNPKVLQQLESGVLKLIHTKEIKEQECLLALGCATSDFVIVFMGNDDNWGLVEPNTQVVQNLAENISSMKVFEI